MCERGECIDGQALRCPTHRMPQQHAQQQLHTRCCRCSAPRRAAATIPRTLAPAIGDVAVITLLRNIV
jgi:hypothetical protein